MLKWKMKCLIIQVMYYLTANKINSWSNVPKTCVKSLQNKKKIVDDAFFCSFIFCIIGNYYMNMLLVLHYYSQARFSTKTLFFLKSFRARQFFLGQNESNNLTQFNEFHLLSFLQLKIDFSLKYILELKTL